MNFYAYYIPEKNLKGIVDTWEKCFEITKNTKARYKKFKSENDAKIWLDTGANYDKTKKQDKLIEDAIYFDAGTGRKIGVEARITDVNKNSLLHFILSQNHINTFGNYHIENKTNNYGELLAFYFALKYCLKYNKKTICGDSSLVINYWSKNIYNKNSLNEETVQLINKTHLLYKKFIENGGNVIKISGDINPADLGFHR